MMMRGMTVVAAELPIVRRIVRDGGIRMIRAGGFTDIAGKRSTEQYERECERRDLSSHLQPVYRNTSRRRIASHGKDESTAVTARVCDLRRVTRRAVRATGS